MGQFYDLKKVIGDPAQKDAGPVLSKKLKESLCMWAKTSERMSASTRVP